ncbi:MAG: hypothetical protein ACRD6B_01300 [Bryobacteraceae bacterium]
MDLPRFVLIEQSFPDRSIRDIPARIRQELSLSGIAKRVRPGARVAIGVGSRGISNINAIVKSVVEFWKEQGAQPFIFPAMGSHGAATAEGQADVLAHFGIHEATMGAPVISSLDVVPLGKTPEGMETFLDKNAYESDGVFLIGRVKWHTDFSGSIESGIHKMMAIGLGKFAGARQYHSFGYKLGLERVIRSAGAQVFASGKILGALAVQEGAHHETAGLVAIDAGIGIEAIVRREEALLAEVKSWMATLPASEIDVLIVDEIGKNISGAGMDTKVINRSVNCQYNPFPNTPMVHRIYARGLTDLSYGSGVGIGMADVIHSSLLSGIDWKPTYINSLTACTPACIRTPIHFGSDRDVLDHIAPTVGKTELSQVTYCRIPNTQELIHLAVSENLIPALYPQAKVVSAPFEVPFLDSNDFGDFETAAREQTNAENVGSRMGAR